MPTMESRSLTGLLCVKWSPQRQWSLTRSPWRSMTRHSGQRGHRVHDDDGLRRPVADAAEGNEEWHLLRADHNRMRHDCGTAIPTTPKGGVLRTSSRGRMLLGVNHLPLLNSTRYRPRCRSSPSGFMWCDNFRHDLGQPTETSRRNDPLGRSSSTGVQGDECSAPGNKHHRGPHLRVCAGGRGLFLQLQTMMTNLDAKTRKCGVVRPRIQGWANAV